jgi:hypothetical protein
MSRPEISNIPIHLPLGKSVLAVELYDKVASKNIFTFHREGSHCTFSEVIPYGEFELTLRLDWGDLIKGDPTLDLDVKRVEPNGTRKTVKPKHNPQHHTNSKPWLQNRSDPLTYDLQYEGLSMRLVARKSFATGVGASIYVVDPEHNPEPPPK